MIVFTLGYEGIGAEEFWAILRAHGVQALIDVRAVPLSRKPGFSKGALKLNAAQNKIRYENWTILGCPGDIRDDYRKDNNWQDYSKRFNSYLAMQGDAVAELAIVSSVSVCCLLCYEADYRRCHRSYVAAAVSQQCTPGTLRVTHLRGQVKAAPIGPNRGGMASVGIATRQ